MPPSHLRVGARVQVRLFQISQPEIGKIVEGPKFRNNEVIFKVELDGWMNWYPADRIHPVANLL